MKQAKIALFYDWVNQWGGAEKVLLDLIKIYPDAPIFTLVYDQNKTSWLPKEIKIVPSIINKLPLAKNNPIIYTPFYSIALELFDFSSFDIVISTTSTVGHCLMTPPHVLFICYYHNINRYVYQTPTKFKILKPFLNIYQRVDSIYSTRPDYIICNSQTVKNRIKKQFCRDANIIHPGIDTTYFKPSKNPSKDKYFLLVSRLVSHKKIDIAIKACHQLNLILKIVGEGREKDKLLKLIKSLNTNKIELLGKVSNKKLICLYQNCQALISPQEEDFGLTPIEAQACGKPVIAYKKGGLTETVVANKTGIFFEKQTTKSLVKALIKFKKLKFSPEDCITNSCRFSSSSFMLNFKQTIDELWQLHLKKIII